ncbi:PREDICTED: aprataxin and PNK-like factor isoform X1 [Papilio xuthus]|uniref:Aprataxin and PNK-like factor isoform X1 n=1 Tax=Papilio xuthus TaxID=66420 RepID=A0AAJ6ZGX7_PAPXU|nr:PREDICTED: aprataxin and PNK-like factor isoform X1 [Papilio xuthus]
MFKLVRIDDEAHREIPLTDGKQVIGRGNLLECDDKRVSRNHAEIEIVEDSIIIKALHINPCFVVSDTMGEVKIIFQNTIMKVKLGDKVGFLNDKFWYNICKNNEKDDICSSVIDFEPLKDIINKYKDIRTLNYDTNSEENYHKSEQKLTKERISNETENEESNKESVSPSILTDNLKTQEIILNNELKEQQSNENEIKTQEQSDLSQSPGKRCLIKRELSSPVDIKKLKTENNVDDKSQSPNSQAGTSSGASSASSASPSKEQKSKRERCMYGEKCYRKNPQHKAQFSHPGDCDWGSGAQAPCPWGYACARRDPRHWRDHSHPYGMHPPPPAGRRKKKTKRSSSGETPMEDLIVTGKRSRKTIQRETWSGSESGEEDPYGTDDSDDWQPPSDVSETQDYSQASQFI